MYLILSNVTLWALLILSQVHLLKHRLFREAIDGFCAKLYIGLAVVLCIAQTFIK